MATNTKHIEHTDILDSLAHLQLNRNINRAEIKSILVKLNYDVNRIPSLLISLDYFQGHLAKNIKQKSSFTLSSILLLIFTIVFFLFKQHLTEYYSYLIEGESISDLGQGLFVLALIIRKGHLLLYILILTSIYFVSYSAFLQHKLNLIKKNASRLKSML